MRHSAGPAVRPLLAIIALAMAVVGMMAATGASARPALADVCNGAEAIYNQNSGLVAEVYDSSAAWGGSSTSGGTTKLRPSTGALSDTSRGWISWNACA
jgi:hypothetical protein